MPTKAPRLLAACLALPTIMSTPAWADIISVDLTATVSHVQGLPIYGLSANLGDLVTAHFSYDTDAPDMDIDPMWGVYYSGSAQISFGGHSISVSGPVKQVILDNPGPYDFFDVMGGAPVGTGPMLVDGVATDGYLVLAFSQPTGLADDGMPDLAVFNTLDVWQFFVTDPDIGTYYPGLIDFDHLQTITATSSSRAVDPIPEPIPEPSTWALLGLGVVAMFGMAVRGRSRIAPEIAVG